MSAAPILRVVTCREMADCAIVALAMYLGHSYEDVLRAVTVSDRHQGKRGLWSRTIVRIAARLGHQLKRKHAIDWESDYGILRLPDHAVVLRNGLVFETDGTVWDVDAYLAHRDLKVDEVELMVADGD